MSLGFTPALCCLLSILGEVGGLGEGRTRLPLTYVLDYGPNHLGHPEWLQAVASAPPVLLHLGKDVPMTHNWGPIAALGGENQAYGKGHYIRRLSPEEVRERLAGLREMVAKLHAAGVKYVLPYICSMTLAGHHERRAGFWEFYDHWEEYAPFGLGPRPPADPADWMQRTLEGDFQRFYKYTGDFYPPYEPNHRYAACVNNPHWRYWLTRVVTLIAQCGYEGAFVDNSGSQRCYCRYCQEKFREFIHRRYSAAERTRLGLTDDLLSAKPLRGQPPSLVWVEAQRFWAESLHQHQLALRAAGEQARSADRPTTFLIFPNGGERRPQHVKCAFADSDYVMFERSRGDYGTHPGTARFPVVENLYLRHVNDNVFEYKYTLSLRKRVRALVLTRPGWPRTQDWLRMNPAVAELMNAEAAAFSGGGGGMLRPRWEVFGPVLNRYRQFFAAHPQLYVGLEPWAQVGVAAFAEQEFYGHHRHIQSVRQLTQLLLDAHLLFDYLTEERFLHELPHYAAVFVADVKYLSPAQARALEEYVQGGGVAFVTGPPPTANLQMEPFPTPEWANLTGGAEEKVLGARVQRWGQGLCLASDRLPRREQLPLWLRQGIGRELTVLSGPDTALRRAVRVNAFRSPKRLVLHVVNYNVPLGLNAPQPEPLTDLSFSVPLPAGWREVRVTAYEPGPTEGERLSAKVEGDRVQFTLPSLRVYRVVEIVPVPL